MKHMQISSTSVFQCLVHFSMPIIVVWCVVACPSHCNLYFCIDIYMSLSMQLKKKNTIGVLLEWLEILVTAYMNLTVFFFCLCHICYPI